MTEQCEKMGAYRYTWPGRDEAHVCEAHSGYLKAVADAIGMHLQLIPSDAGQCQQQVSKQLSDSTDEQSK